MTGFDEFDLNLRPEAAEIRRLAPKTASPTLRKSV